MKKYTLLFIDDDDMLLAGLRRMLHSVDDECWEFRFASSGAAGLKKLDEMDIDAVVADMNMPLMNGLDLLTQVRVLYPAVMRIMMTGRSDYQVCHQAMTFCQYFLWKPIEFKAICTLLQLISKDAVTINGVIID